MNAVLVSSLLNAGLLLLLGAALYAAPSALLNPKTVPFGVRVPPSRAEDPQVGAVRRRYRAAVLWATAVATAAAAGEGALLEGVAAVVVTGLLLCAVAAVVWLRAHRALAEAKKREQWYAGLRQGVVADTSLRTDPVRVPWAWSVPSGLVIAATVAVGAAVYPALPDTLAIPTRTGDGTRHHEVATTFWTAFSPVFGQVLGTAAVLALVAALLRARPDLEASRPAAGVARHRRFLAATSRALLAVCAVADVMLLGLSVMVWSGDRSTAPLFAVVGIPALVTFGIVAGLVVRVGPGARRRVEGQATGNAAEAADTADAVDSGLVQRDDDRYWYAGGTVYANGGDPAVLVPSRVGMGWTLNLGNPRALTGMIVVLVAAGSAALATAGLLA
ncbi:DUF5808 domain-containing protein [Streptomyces tubbatahanensis]|uniref:DUF5808 domain-containing protein n=1 Tax=Streptomyces tubbatahanensis TaxID=2923272 RepID=A0ABY3Y284_9ACTN|nr:DUF5808 domain-containing protein [Streptomyces tubbatahanensis]UNT00694.1 DUF5808 domain-containing protein [Streptomyces tubbatahanensis]